MAGVGTGSWYGTSCGLWHSSHRSSFYIRPRTRPDVFLHVTPCVTRRRRRGAGAAQQCKGVADSKDDLTAVVVGGGPCGLAAAMLLVQEGFAKVDVIEQRETPDYFEPDKSFVYSIDGRGQQFMELVGAMDLLAERGVGTKDFAISRLYPNGKIKRKKVQIKDDSQETFWIPRANFVRLLFDLIQDKFSDKISVHLASTCVNIALEKASKSPSPGAEEADRIKVFASKKKKEKEQERLVLTPNLLIGADGLKSKVRDTLVEWEKDEGMDMDMDMDMDKAKDGGSPSDKFQMRKYPSLSSGLRYKVLSLPPRFTLDQAGTCTAVHKEAYVAIGALNTFQERIRLGLLPIQDENARRTANFITAAEDHVVWKARNGEEILKFLERALPQLPIRKIVSEEEANRFAESEGGRFPSPQYVENFQKVLSGGKCGVVLVGDALHAFPPDLGQGVNAGLEDIMVLRKSLQNHESLGEALPSFEQTRLPDVRALIRLMQIGYPLQYNQYKFLKLLWTVKFSLQLLLSKVLPMLGFTKPPFLDIQNPKKRYRDILAQTEKMAKTYQISAHLLGALSSLWCLLKHKNYLLAAALLVFPAVLIRLTYEESPLSLMNAKEM